MMLGSQSEKNKTKDMNYYYYVDFNAISFVLYPSA